MFIDTHFHLVNEGYDIDEVLNRAREKGLGKFIVSGSDRSDNKLNMKLLDEYADIYLTCGFHPSMALKVEKDDFDYLEECLSNPRVVAVGEIGLDYYYGKDDKEAQKELFIKQLDLAVKYNLPVVIHTRDAYLDTYNILRNYNLKGVIHCFSGSLEVAQSYIDLGYYLGIGGVITFKNSNLKALLEKIGLDRVVLETDSPYLSPIRGEKNEPGNVRLVGEFLANLLNMDVSLVAKITSSNAERIFDLESKL